MDQNVESCLCNSLFSFWKWLWEFQVRLTRGRKFVWKTKFKNLYTWNIINSWSWCLLESVSLLLITATSHLPVNLFRWIFKSLHRLIYAKACLLAQVIKITQIFLWTHLDLVHNFGDYELSAIDLVTGILMPRVKIKPSHIRRMVWSKTI